MAETGTNGKTVLHFLRRLSRVVGFKKLHIGRRSPCRSLLEVRVHRWTEYLTMPRLVPLLLDGLRMAKCGRFFPG